MTEQERMEQALKQDPKLGRIGIVRAARVSKYKAQMFLEQQRNPVPAPGSDTAKVKIKEDPLSILTAQEKKLILTGMQYAPIASQTFDWSGDYFKFAFFTDPHFGHLEANPIHWQKTCDLIEKEQCEFAICGGDLTEGMPNRPGHFYELNAVGANAQLEMAQARIEMLPCIVYGIDGNHDLWGYKTIGFDPSAMLGKLLPNKYYHMGMHEFDLHIGNIVIKTWHGEDGSTYALSYRLQKFVEALTGGSKPHILLAGHDHKSGFFEFRNVLCFAGGTLEGQTKWMRNKKIAAMVGFWIIEVWRNADGIERVRQMWIPYYK